MNKFLTALGTIVIAVVALVAATEISKALDRARNKRAALAAADVAAASDPA